ncbi:MAG: prolipoprotein diacylglyceryl transferase [Prevotella sp.]|nr:prolipoprotein diacylglyceryl transferase [Prevotella sp.]
MIYDLLYIVWNPSEVIFHLGSLGIRWYSMCWLVGLFLGYLLMSRLYKEQRIPEEKFDPLFIYIFVSVLTGARLGHCLFYQPDYFLSTWDHFVEMLIPFRHLADGSWKFVGYEGLSSHGGIIGMIIAIFIYSHRNKLSVWIVLDNMGICSGITATFIRLGNLMNSEIIGRVTDVPWAFIFVRVDQYPRHPGQLYEAMSYALFFFIIYSLYRRHREKVGTGFFFGLCLTLVFIARFFIEFVKDIQVDFEAGMAFNMGQLLSIPFLIIGIACMVDSNWKRKLGAHSYLEDLDKKKQEKK